MAPNDCFLLNICSEKQILPRIFYSLRTVKNPSDYRKYSFSHFTLQVRLFFIEERKPKIFGIKNVMERGIRKILSFVNLKPLWFRKDSSCPRMTEEIQILQRRLECISRDLKVFWIVYRINFLTFKCIHGLAPWYLQELLDCLQV